MFRSDDGFGCEVARQLALRALPEGVRVVDYGIRGLHLAYDLLDGWEALIIVDTVPAAGDPGAVQVVRVDPDDVAGRGFDARGGDPDGLDGSGFDTHGMDPASMLASLKPMGGRLPATIVVGCEPLSLDDGMGLSAPVAAAVGTAVDRVLGLVREVGSDAAVKAG